MTRGITDIDIHIVHQPYDISKRKYKRLGLVTSKLFDYFTITVLILILTLFNSYVYQVGFKTIGLTYILLILISSLFYSRGPLIYAAALSSLLWNIIYMFSETPMIYDWSEIIFVLLFFSTAMITGMLAGRVKEREILLQQREEKSQAIYEIVRAIASARSNEQAFKAVNERVGSLLKGDCKVIIKDQSNKLEFTPELGQFDEKDRTVAIWCFENGKEAGWGTETLPLVSQLYLPIRGYSEIFGSLCFKPLNTQNHLTIEEMNIIHTIAQQLGYYLERYYSNEPARQREYKQKIEKLHQTLFNSISDELKTPLISIKNAVKHLKRNKTLMPIQEPLTQIEHSSENLSRFVENILLMAQIGEGFFSVHAEPNSISELIEVCLASLKKTMIKHKIIISIQEELPLIPFDFSLLEILFCNVLLNAANYSPEGSSIEVEAKIDGQHIRLAVKDQGQGIPPDLLNTIFQKFYKIPGTPSEGMGLGLPIAKAIAELHQGTLEARNRSTGGAEFYLLLPLKPIPFEKQRKLRKL